MMTTESCSGVVLSIRTDVVEGEAERVRSAETEVAEEAVE